MDDPPRDLIGYGARPPQVEWPQGARLALNLVLNYEEGAETCMLNGDACSETLLSEMSGLVPRAGARPQRRIQLRVRQPGGVLARSAPVRGTHAALHHLRRRFGDRAKPGGRGRNS